MLNKQWSKQVSWILLFPLLIKKFIFEVEGLNYFYCYCIHQKILGSAGDPSLHINTHVLVAPVSLAAVGVVEEATPVVGAAAGRTVEVGV